LNNLAFNLSEVNSVCALPVPWQTELKLFFSMNRHLPLDPIATASIEALIGRLKEKVTILIVTHSSRPPVFLTTQPYVLDEMVEFNETKTIFFSPRRNRPKTM